MRVLVTGAGGLVGWALCRELVGGPGSDHEVHATARSRPAPAGVVAHRVELSEPGAAARLVESILPHVVVHTAYSMSELERDVVVATTEVARACARGGVALVHVSTDAVFDGEHAPYAEDVVPTPVHPYGAAKWAAEQAVQEVVPTAAIVRTALIAHLDIARPDSSTQWLLDAQRRGEEVTLFTDEIRSVVRLEDLVDVLARLAQSDPEVRRGVWHVGGPDRLSRWELGEIVAARFGLDRSLIRPGLAAALPGRRPRDVSLACDRLAQLSVRPGPIDTVTDHGQANG